MRNLRLAVFAFVAMGLGLSLGQHSRTQPPISVSADGALYYLDPTTSGQEAANPRGVSDCGVQFLAVHSDDLAAYNGERNFSQSAEAVAIDAASQKAFDIEVARVERTGQSDSVRVLGRVVADPTRIYRVNIAADGFVKEVTDTGVGSYVKRDQRLAVIYSQEFLSVAGGYLSASERTQGKETSPTSQGVAGPQNWADRLRNLGMSDSQIGELTVTRKIPEVVYISSPIDGFILARNISPGQKFDRYTEFYRIADLERVWIVADLFPNEAQYFRPGVSAHLTIPGEHRTFTAKVADVLPQINGSTRTLQIRLEAENHNLVFRPDMYLDVDLPGPATTAVTIPIDAVLHSEERDYVYVEGDNNWFEPREVETGRYLGNRVEILKGLREGEQLVSAGTFLVDAERRRREDHGLRSLARPIPVAAIRAARCALPGDSAAALASGQAVAYGGATYYFCSKVCRDKFQHDPTHYLASQQRQAGHD